jgi:ketosteroid isomerase-like protein
MKIHTKSLLIVLCITLLGSAQLFGQEWSDEQKEVWATVESGWQAWIDGDISEIQSFRADDYRGWDESSQAPRTLKEFKAWAERWIQKNKLVLFHISPVAIDIHGDIAIVFFSFQLVSEHKDGSEQDLKGNAIDIYRKINDKWLLIADTGFDYSSSKD